MSKEDKAKKKRAKTLLKKITKAFDLDVITPTRSYGKVGDLDPINRSALQVEIVEARTSFTKGQKDTVIECTLGRFLGDLEYLYLDLARRISRARSRRSSRIRRRTASSLPCDRWVLLKPLPGRYLVEVSMSESEQYVVQYKVKGFEGIQKAGPYSGHEVTSQYDDIRLYEGVYDCQIIRYKEDSSQNREE